MKKRFVSICLALLFTFAPASAAFSDISNSSLSQTTAVLDALGIMQGVGSNKFNPDGLLTRAQFCKIAVTAMGVSDVSAYANYTIFPDVKHSHWAAAYINAAVRHPDLKDRQSSAAMWTAPLDRIRQSTLAKCALCYCVCWDIPKRISDRSGQRIILPRRSLLV